MGEPLHVFTGPGPLPLRVEIHPPFFTHDRYKNGKPRKTGEWRPAWARMLGPHFPFQTHNPEDLRVHAQVLLDAADALEKEQANA